MSDVAIQSGEPVQASDSLESKINTLQKQNKLMGAAIIGLLILVIPLLFTQIHEPQRAEAWPAVSANEITTKRLTLLDEDGKQGAVLTTINRRPFMLFIDGKGESGLTLTTNDSGGFVTLNRNDKASLTLSPRAILLGDTNGSSIFMQAGPGQESYLELKDQSGYSARLGQSLLAHPADGSTSLTSAATLVGSGKGTVSQWSLIRSTPPATTNH